MLSVKKDNTKILQMKCKITFYKKKKENKTEKQNMRSCMCVFLLDRNIYFTLSTEI